MTAQSLLFDELTFLAEKRMARKVLINYTHTLVCPRILQ